MGVPASSFAHSFEEKNKFVSTLQPQGLSMRLHKIFEEDFLSHYYRTVGILKQPKQWVAIFEFSSYNAAQARMHIFMRKMAWLFMLLSSLCTVFALGLLFFLFGGIDSLAAQLFALFCCLGVTLWVFTYKKYLRPPGT